MKYTLTFLASMALPCFVFSASVDLKQENKPPETYRSWNMDSKLVFYDKDTAIYYSKDMNQTVNWPFKFSGNVWRHMKKSYGPFGKEERLYVVFTSGKSSPGTMGTSITVGGTYMDNRHKEKNVIEFHYSHNGGDDPNYKDPMANDRFISFKDGKYGFKEEIMKNVVSIIDGMNANIEGAAMKGLWYFDNIVYDFFITETYKVIKDPNAKLAQDVANKRESVFPGDSVFWNRDFFFPMYNQGGKSQLVSKWYKQLATNWTKKANGKTPSGSPKFKYTKDTMNYGECVHFWSGAMGKCVKELAKKAWGQWDEEMENEYQTAKKDFPGIQYDEEDDNKA